nr:hypothetical protein [Tanacetum cinerariifolium]
MRDYWIKISSAGDFLSTVPSYTLIKEPLRRLCHRLIAFSIIRRGHAPEKHALGRKQAAKMSGGHLIARVGVHFGVIIEQSLQTLTMKVRELTTIDINELVRLRICDRLGDFVTWVVMGLERQLSIDKSMFATWMIGRMTQLIDVSRLSTTDSATA